MLPVRLTGRLKNIKLPFPAVDVVRVRPVTGSVYLTVAPSIGRPVEELMITPDAPPVGVGVTVRTIAGKALVTSGTTTAGIGMLAVIPGAETVILPLELIGNPIKA
jgi:hypothetical protein